jgi:hypothetical protein
VDGPIDLELVGDEAWILASDSAELVRVTLADQQEIGSNPAGSLPTVLAVGSEGQALIGDLGATNGERLLVIDPASGDVQRFVTDDQVQSISFMPENLLWLLNRNGLVQQYDLPPGRPSYAREVTVDPNEHMEVVAAGSYAWAGSDSGPLTRIQVPHAVTDGTLDAGGGVPLLYRDGIVWGARPDEIWGIDTTTNEVSRHVALANLIEILAMDIADSEAWVAARRPGRVGTILRIDLESGEVMGEWPASLPASIKVGADAVWAVDYETDELIRIPR